MRRRLAKEALYHSTPSSTDERFDGLSAALEQAPKRIRRLDPDGKKGLALLSEIEKRQNQSNCD